MALSSLRPAGLAAIRPAGAGGCRAGPAAAAAPQRAAAPGRRSLLAAAGGGGSGGDAGHGSGPPASANSPPLDNTYDDYNILKGDLADSNAGFLLKLVALSFAGGAAIKYGSLLIPLPHSPNAAAALAFVILPPVIWAAQALAKSR